MCGIVGALFWDGTTDATNWQLGRVMRNSIQRGRDGRGWAHLQNNVVSRYRSVTKGDDPKLLKFPKPVKGKPAVVVGNLRAEPTTEYVNVKSLDDQQPYMLGKWTVVHNGTIANDKELRTDTLNTRIDSAAIVEALDKAPEGLTNFETFHYVIDKLVGSYAILAFHSEQPDRVYAACNYRPIWYSRSENGFMFASARDYLIAEPVPTMLEPYTVACFSRNNIATRTLLSPVNQKRALVVCSGGLDSVVAATQMVREGYKVELIHFQYGSRAEGPEVQAVKAVANDLDVPLRFFNLPIYKPEYSPLLREDSSIAGGEAGAEFAHEWVPARNLVMLSIATAIAEAEDFGVIVLGNNLEEAGAYPDNEPEFINRFNEVLPFAVGDGKKVRVQMPVGNLMKHEIVALGHAINAPMAKTWSCYRAGAIHCGTCGPCFMRRTAFEINGLPELIKYECEEA